MGVMVPRARAEEQGPAGPLPDQEWYLPRPRLPSIKRGVMRRVDDNDDPKGSSWRAAGPADLLDNCDPPSGRAEARGQVVHVGSGSKKNNLWN